MAFRLPRFISTAVGVLSAATAVGQANHANNGLSVAPKTKPALAQKSAEGILIIKDPRSGTIRKIAQSEFYNLTNWQDYVISGGTGLGGGTGSGREHRQAKQKTSVPTSKAPDAKQTANAAEKAAAKEATDRAAAEAVAKETANAARVAAEAAAKEAAAEAVAKEAANAARVAAEKAAAEEAAAKKTAQLPPGNEKAAQGNGEKDNKADSNTRIVEPDGTLTIGIASWAKRSKEYTTPSEELGVLLTKYEQGNYRISALHWLNNANHLNTNAGGLFGHGLLSFRIEDDWGSGSISYSRLGRNNLNPAIWQIDTNMVAGFNRFATDSPPSGLAPRVMYRAADHMVDYRKGTSDNYWGISAFRDAAGKVSAEVSVLKQFSGEQDASTQPNQPERIDPALPFPQPQTSPVATSSVGASFNTERGLSLTYNHDTYDGWQYRANIFAGNIVGNNYNYLFGSAARQFGNYFYYGLSAGVDNYGRRDFSPEFGLKLNGATGNLRYWWQLGINYNLFNNSPGLVKGLGVSYSTPIRVGRGNTPPGRTTIDGKGNTMRQNINGPQPGGG